jgi:hypothetical protein
MATCYDVCMAADLLELFPTHVWLVQYFLLEEISLEPHIKAN